MARQYPAASRSVIAVLLWPDKGATPEALLSEIGRVQNATRGVAGIELPSQIRELASFAAELGEPVVMPLKVTVSEDRARNIVKSLGPRLGVGRSRSDHVEVHLLGESALWAGLEETAKTQLTKAETIGFPILFGVLLVIFGSIGAALMPLSIGLVALVITGATIYLLSQAISLSIFTIDAASMLGIGIAIDYSLIFMSRLRQELQDRDFSEARRVALTTSGSAIVFSGLTVIAALGGVLIIPIGALRSMAVGAAVIVVASVLAATTLLPALATVLGSRRISANWLAAMTTGRRRRRSRRSIGWEWWTGIVGRHPLVVMASVGAVVLALCAPVLSMRTDTGVLQQLSTSNETRVGFQEAAQLAGPGVLGPVSVVVHANRPVSRKYLLARVEDIRQLANAERDVHTLGRTEVSSSGTYATFTVVPSVNPESQRAEHLVEVLRAGTRKALAATGLSVVIGGASATQLDEVHKIGTSMWKLLLAVLALSLVPLVVLLRSVLLPVKAVIMNLLSVGAAYGVLVIVFQWGALDSLLHYHSPGHIDTLVPPLLLAIAFGLSTDYEVFLLTRIRERWLISGDPQRAVVEGVRMSAGTISGAALIIVCVFAVFLGTGIPVIKEVGLGGAVAIGIDATLIRLALVPAAMAMLGEWSWWLPRPAARLLRPPAPVEGVAPRSL
jgi:RND superfamily putative drug exporter